MRTKVQGMKERLNSMWSGIALPSLAEGQLLKWFGEFTDSKANIYDKAMDSEYLRSHVGGGDHRLFDGGHDIFSAWEKVRSASETDTFSQEVIGYVSSLWKDVTTLKGLPFKTVDKGSFDSWVESISSWGVPGLDREFLYDLLSFDALEVVASGVGCFGVLFGLKKRDKEKVAEILSSMGIVTITSANPIMGILTVGLTVYSYRMKKMEIDKKSILKGGVLTSTSLLIFSVLGLPFLVEFALVLVVSSLLKKHFFKKAEVATYFKAQVLQLASFKKSDLVPKEDPASSEELEAEIKKIA